MFSLVALYMPPLTTEGTHFSTLPSALIVCSIYASGPSGCCELIGFCNLGLHVFEKSSYLGQTRNLDPQVESEGNSYTIVTVLNVLFLSIQLNGVGRSGLEISF